MPAIEGRWRSEYGKMMSTHLAEAAAEVLSSAVVDLAASPRDLHRKSRKGENP